MQRSRSRKNTRLFRTLLSCFLLIVCCMGVFLFPQSAYAYENTNTVQNILPEETFLRVYDISAAEYIVYQSNTSGVAVFSNPDYSTPYVPDYGFSTTLLLPNDYGVNKIFTISLSLLFDVSQSDVYKAFSYSSFSFIVNNITYYQNSPEVSNVHFVSSGDTTSQPYEVTISFDFDASSLDLSDDVSFSFLLQGSGLEYDTSVGFYMQTTFKYGSLNIDYSVKTSGDIANEKLDDLNSNVEDLQDSLTTPSPEVSSDVEDFSSAVQDAFDSIADQEASWEQSIEAIYESYGVDPDSMEAKFADVVADLRLEVASGWLSDLWSFLKDYKYLYLFLNTGLVFCMIVFLLRR